MAARETEESKKSRVPLDEEVKERHAIGSRIRQARIEAGYRSSAKFGEAIGVRYQQVLKYEKGKDWANSFMLKRIARATGKSSASVPVGRRACKLGWLTSDSFSIAGR